MDALEVCILEIFSWRLVRKGGLDLDTAVLAIEAGDRDKFLESGPMQTAPRLFCTRVWPLKQYYKSLRGNVYAVPKPNPTLDCKIGR